MNSELQIASSMESKDFSHDFDYVMVFPMIEDSPKHYIQSPYAKHVVQCILDAGFEIYCYLSVQYDELYVLIKCPDAVLLDFTDKIDFTFKLDPEYTREVLSAGSIRDRIKPVIIRDDPKITTLKPFEYIYCKYERSYDQNFYQKAPGTDSFLSNMDRLKLIEQLLVAPTYLGGCDLEISKMLLKKRLLTFFPVHDREELKALTTEVMDMYAMPWRVPYDKIRDYFGEKIALYYVFSGHYSAWLIVPSIIGFAFQFAVWGTLDFSSPILPFFSVIITIWAIAMLEYWKRNESYTAMRWGMSDFEKTELDRPEFFGDLIDSHINGKKIIYYPEEKFYGIASLTYSVVVTFLMLVIGIVAAIYVLRFQLQGDIGDYASGIASVINSAQITVMNIVYQYVAIGLTDAENHRTETGYQDAMIIKVFIFQFINSYASFFFIAFIAQFLARPSSLANDGEEGSYVGQCGYSNCMQPLSINLATIFGSRLVVTNIIDVTIPYFSYMQKKRKETEDVPQDKKMTPPEEDYLLMQYDTLQMSIKNYADIAIEFGYAVLFITALPIAVFLALVNNYLKVKFEVWKLVELYQRPVPQGIQDIGQWQLIFTIISVAAVITNAGLICFTMTVLDTNTFTSAGKVWVFVGYQWTLIFLQFVLSVIVPDVPYEVQVQLERSEFITKKVEAISKKIEDDDFHVEYEETDINESEENPSPTAGIRESLSVKPKSKTCCSCKGGKERNKKIRGNLPEVIYGTYPISKLPEQWPKLLSKSNQTNYQPFQSSYSNQNNSI